MIRLAMRFGMSVEEIYDIAKIDKWFLNQIKEISDFESELQTLFKSEREKQKEIMFKAKQYGFSDGQIAALNRKTRDEVRAFRKKLGIIPSYKTVDTCGGEFEAKASYYYSAYESEDEVRITRGQYRHKNDCKRRLTLRRYRGYGIQIGRAHV